MHYIFLSFVHEIIHKCEAKVTIILIEGHPFVTFERIGNYYKCNLTTMFLEQYCPLQRPFLSFFLTQHLAIYFQSLLKLRIVSILFAFFSKTAPPILMKLCM